jgi:hypothetical protein
MCKLRQTERVSQGPVLDLPICVKSSTRISDVKQRSLESRKKIMRVLKVSGDGSSEKSEILSR